MNEESSPAIAADFRMLGADRSDVQLLLKQQDVAKKSFSIHHHELAFPVVDTWKIAAAGCQPDKAGEALVGLPQSLFDNAITNMAKN